MRKELLNTQIEALSVEHGAQIVEFYKSHGFDTRNYKGVVVGYFYGVDKNGLFDNHIFYSGLKTITLEQAKQLVDTKSDLYTEITAYKLQSGIIVETKEQAEILSKEIKIRLDLSEIVAEDYVDIIMKNLETIKQIINQ